MDETDLKVASVLILMIAVLIGALLPAVFDEEIKAFVNYHFTEEFLIWFGKIVVLVVWLVLLSIGLLLFAFVEFKQRRKDKHD